MKGDDPLRIFLKHYHRLSSSKKEQDQVKEEQERYQTKNFVERVRVVMQQRNQKAKDERKKKS